MRAAVPAGFTISILLSLLLFSGCHSSGSGAGQPVGIRPEDGVKYLGTYSGSFNKSIITLVINYISGNTASGYNIHKGLRRNINGEVTRDGSQLSFVMKEPGDNPYDGVFYFTLDTANLAIRGKWQPLDSIKLKPKTLALSRKAQAEEYNEENQWFAGSGAAGDSSLTFKEDGTCEFNFYERPSDSTSQLMTIRGNFERVTDTFRVEWEKNKHTPAQSMKLIIIHEKYKDQDSTEYEQKRLQGNGWNFKMLEAG